MNIKNKYVKSAVEKTPDKVNKRADYRCCFKSALWQSFLNKLCRFCDNLAIIV